MEKVLILGGSHRDIPLINAAKELGLFVITLANRNDYIGHSYADKFYKIDFNNFKEIKNIINKEKIKHLIPGCGEASYINTVILSHELKIGNFDLIETAKLLHNKWKFKKFCLENEVCTPKGFLYDSKTSLSNINFPVVIKPTQLSGGNGVSIVNTQDELLEQLKITQKVSNEIFIEEHIEGKLIAYSVFLKDQKIIYSFSGKDDSGVNPYLITTAYPILLDKDIEQKICTDIETIAKKLNLVDGMFHLQIIIKGQLPYIIDVTRRIPGDLYPWLMEYCDGVKYSKAVVKAYLDKEINNEFSNKKKNQDFVVRYVVMPNQNGIFKNITIDSTLQEKVIYKLDLVEQNTPIDNYLTTQLAIVFIQLNDYDRVIIENLSDFVYIAMEIV